MATGALLFPIGYAPTDNGAVVAGGKLYFYRTGTTTAQNTYSDSTLLSANANPVVLNSEGTLDSKVYGDPASGYDYRVTLKTSADVTIWTVDDVVVDAADSATFSSGSFTGSLTGYASGPTGAVTYRIFANSAGTGKFCVLHVASAITGTSNATSLTMTGLPSACQPTIQADVQVLVTDNGGVVNGRASIAAAGSTVTFSMGSPLSSTGFTNPGTKGLHAGWTMGYPLG